MNENSTPVLRRYAKVANVYGGRIEQTGFTKAERMLRGGEMPRMGRRWSGDSDGGELPAVVTAFAAGHLGCLRKFQMVVLSCECAGCFAIV